MRGIGALQAAAALVAAFLVTAPAQAAVEVQGVPEWLLPSVEQSAEAVWQQIRRKESSSSGRERLAAMVSRRLFQGYRVPEVSVDGKNLRLLLEPETEPPTWWVSVDNPGLEDRVLRWFRRDAAILKRRVWGLVAALPVDALGWADRALREAVGEAGETVFPGWGITPSVHIREQHSAELRIALHPEPPLLLALLPRFRSTTLPLMFQEELRDDVLERLSPLAGLPLPWVTRHSSDIGAWVRAVMGSEELVRKTKSEVTPHFEPDTISRLEVQVESRRYTIWAWAAAFAGTDEHYPEVGVHLGHKAQFWSGWDAELYGEWLTELDDFALETRWGLRWYPMRRLWLGAEWSSNPGGYWYRVQYDGARGRPYLWLRYSENGEANGAVGWRTSEHTAFELYFDERDEDTLCIRAVGNL
ncbi:MAG: hypothetical protein K9L28_04005 [Synergistales bacterium]|nr:hypothetical protein [Synergistales bacterium]